MSTVATHSLRRAEPESQPDLKKSYWLEEGEEVGDGRAEGSTAIGDRGQAAVSLTPDVDGLHVYIFESSQLEGLWTLKFCKELTVYD